jgi:hypothetical protein
MLEEIPNREMDRKCSKDGWTINEDGALQPNQVDRLFLRVPVILFFVQQV